MPALFVAGHCAPGHRIADPNRDPAIADLAADPDGATLGQRLDPVIDGVLQQRLQNQWRHFHIEWQRLHVPLHRQSLAQAQGLDIQVTPRHGDFRLQCGALIRTVQRGAKQVRQIMDGLLGDIRVRARQRGNGIHAVEQEMGTDACLQGRHPGTGLGLQLLAPLALDKQVAQGDGRDQRADPEAAQQKDTVMFAVDRWQDRATHHQPEGRLAEQRRDQQDQQVTDQHRRCIAQLRQQGPRQA